MLLTCISVRQQPGLMELLDPNGGEKEGKVVLNEDVIGQQNYCQPSCEDWIIAITWCRVQLTGDRFRVYVGLLLDGILEIHEGWTSMPYSINQNLLLSIIIVLISDHILSKFFFV